MIQSHADLLQAASVGGKEFIAGGAGVTPTHWLLFFVPLNKSYVTLPI